MTRPGLLRYGGNVMQLDSQGIQIVNNTSINAPALFYVPEFRTDADGTRPYAVLTGYANVVAGNEDVAALEMGIYPDTGLEGQVGLQSFNTATGVVGAFMSVESGSVISELKLLTSAGAATLELTNAVAILSVTADPSSFTNGMIWYNSTTNLFKARINGATVELGGGGSMPMPPIVSTLGWHGVGSQIITAVSPTSQAWPTSNKAIFVPITVTEDITVVKLWVMNGATASGNLNMSLYDSSFAQVANSEIGSTAQTGTNVIQELDITNVTLTAGLYYIALVLDNTTGTVFGRTSPFSTTEGLQSMGMFEQTSSFDLPATATPAVMASNLIPFCGISTRTLVT